MVEPQFLGLNFVFLNLSLQDRGIALNVEHAENADLHELLMLISKDFRPQLKLMECPPSWIAHAQYAENADSHFDGLRSFNSGIH